MNKIKRLICLILVFTVIFTQFTNLSYAKNNNNNKYKTKFSDLDNNHWAYDSVMIMVERGIIDGYSDGKFKPTKEVTRAEFAKMMVLALDLPLVKPNTPSFNDVEYNDWEYPYVESAKYYLTGFRTSNGDYFKSDNDAVREDMAVALVKALDYDPDKTDLDILDKYKDEDYISTNLRKYVATIIDKGIMVGSDNKYFYPQGTLTRAEAAVLLSRLIDEEKVTYDEEKITYDESYEMELPYLEAAVTDDGIVLEWDKVNSNDFKYYKVVISKYDSTPEYPDDGYLVCLENVNTNRYVVKPYEKYNDGDFGSKVLPGETYYFSITAVYKNGTATGNSIRLTMPEEDDD